MGELTITFANKGPGELILADDWNELVKAIDQQISDAVSDLQGKIDTINGTLNPLVTTVGALNTDVGELKTFRDKTQEALGQFYRLTLRTTSSRFAVGALAEIEAEVTTLAGQKVTTRPWVDFISTWGRLKAVGGFETLMSNGERALSVRTDADGICKVRLSAAFSEGVKEEDEKQFETLLNTPVTAQSQATYKTVFMSATSPADPSVQVAFKSMNTIYKSKNASVVQKYTDNYYLQSTGVGWNQAFQDYYGEWKEYPVTLIAVVKNDIDPLTPDHGRGSSSIQVVYREWINSWVGQYLEIADDEVVDESDNLRDLVDDDYVGTHVKWENYYKNKVQDGGWLDRQRERILFYEAAEDVRVRPPDDAPDFINPLVENTKSTVLFQQTMEVAQAATPYSGGQKMAVLAGAGLPVASGGASAEVVQKNTELETALGQLSGEVQSFGQKVDSLEQGSLELNNGFSALKSEFQGFGGRLQGITALQTEVAGLKQQTLQISKDFDTQRTLIGKAQSDVSVLSGRVEAAIADTGVVGKALAKVDTVSNQVEALKNLDPSKFSEVSSDVVSLLNRVERLELGR